MEQIAFKMQLLPGHAAEYKRRHDEISSELCTLLRDAGISDYSIFLDEETNILFAVLRRRDGHRTDELPHAEVMQRWWHSMADIMVVQADLAPVQRGLVPVFHME
ncbi:L-rhamnose mutarotase [Piscinibacter sp.]|jgi:L-rhamnose mutarotase|uniref:L-rhamnose mutarotase n=1 Tax=Piscinibacter sp. TaxID=1903157 RepID=UPI00355A2F84